VQQSSATDGHADADA